jgi:hypothetical protein
MRRGSCRCVSEAISTLVDEWSTAGSALKPKLKKRMAALLHSRPKKRGAHPFDIVQGGSCVFARVGILRYAEGSAVVTDEPTFESCSTPSFENRKEPALSVVEVAGNLSCDNDHKDLTVRLRNSSKVID